MLLSKQTKKTLWHLYMPYTLPWESYIIGSTKNFTSNFPLLSISTPSNHELLPLGVQEYRMIKIYSTDSSSQLLNSPTNLTFYDVLPPPSIMSESYQLCQLWWITTQEHLFSCMITTPRIMPESYPISISNHE